MKNKKAYVLDTNVYLTNYESIYSFGKNDIIVPLKVLEELDNHKTRQDSVGYNARQTIRVLDELRHEGNLRDGVSLGSKKGTLQIFSCGEGDKELPNEWLIEDPDNQILCTALAAKKILKEEIIVVTRDINMRVKCDAVGLSTEDYVLNQAIISSDDLYSGFHTHHTDAAEIDAFYAGEPIVLDGSTAQLYPNQFIMLQAHDDPKKTALAKYTSEKSPLYCINKLNVWGITPRNREQTFSMDLLLDPSIPLVTLVGKAGTGKTLCAAAAGLQQVMEKASAVYTKMIVSRPVEPLGKDIGFLPGSMEEKMLPWLKPIQDNLRTLFGNDKVTLDLYLDKGTIEVEALSYIRGRSISNSFIIIDEAQNLTQHEIKTIITRVGEGTKLVLIGDIEQIDNIYINETTNGLAHVVERLKGSKLTGHITLNKGERSAIATLASNKL